MRVCVCVFFDTQYAANLSSGHHTRTAEREVGQFSSIQIRYIDTKHQLADTMTKGISHVMNGTIFFICSTSAVSALFAALRISA